LSIDISSVAIEIYNSLNDKRNCISKYTRIKNAVPKEFVHILQGEIIAADPNSNKGHLLQIAFIVLILLLTKDASKLVCFEK
jgi:fructose-1,6-bisphosphatase